jgi:cytochrome c oxidase cbb3-type subunit 2
LDYLGEKQATLGVVRAGPDLANYGWRAPSREEIHRKLYAPRSIHEWSNMPALRALYTVRKIQGPVSDRAIRLTGADAPAEGFEVVPTAEAEELVNYLLSLKKDFPIPGVASAAAAAPAAKK